MPSKFEKGVFIFHVTGKRCVVNQAGQNDREQRSVAPSLIEEEDIKTCVNHIISIMTNNTPHTGAFLQATV